ncbi:hypothetical protein ACQ4PT_031177 [Festuca glaucescens]
MAAALKRAYLAVYNWAVFSGWAQVLYYAVTTLLPLGPPGRVRRHREAAPARADRCRPRGRRYRPPLPQIGSRLFVTWGILWSFPETTTHILVSSLVISWSITEEMEEHYTKRNPKMVKTISLGMPKAPHWIHIKTLGLHTSKLYFLSNIERSKKHGASFISFVSSFCFKINNTIMTNALNDYEGDTEVIIIFLKILMKIIFMLM